MLQRLASGDSSSARLPLSGFKAGDHQLCASAAQLKGHGALCTHALQSGFAFSKGTSESVCFIRLEVEKSSLPVAQKRVCK